MGVSPPPKEVHGTGSKQVPEMLVEWWSGGYGAAGRREVSGVGGSLMVERGVGFGDNRTGADLAGSIANKQEQTFVRQRKTTCARQRPGMRRLARRPVTGKDGRL
jgi:hypothetical protein